MPKAIKHTAVFVDAHVHKILRFSNQLGVNV